jgi:SdrD B-like domain
LLDSTGVVVATTTADQNGAYQFEQPDLGTYTVKEIAPAGIVRTKTVKLTKGEDLAGIDFDDMTVSVPVT